MVSTEQAFIKEIRSEVLLYKGLWSTVMVWKLPWASFPFAWFFGMVPFALNS